MGQHDQPCVIHGRTNCESFVCRPGEGSNAGQVSLNTEGHLALGLGNGLAIDMSDDSLGIQIAPGVTFDMP